MWFLFLRFSAFSVLKQYKILSGNEADTLNRETHYIKSDLSLMFHLQSASFYAARKDFFFIGKVQILQEWNY